MEFNAGERVSLSLDWDVALVDPASGELVGRAGEVLDALAEPSFSAGFMTNTVRISTAVHRNVPGAIAELRALATKVVAAADAAGCGVIGVGVHPYSDWHVQTITPDHHGIELVERGREWSRQLAAWGVGVHVGVEDPQMMPSIIGALGRNYQWLLAPTAASPYWLGQNTGFVSHRTLLRRQVPGAGLPSRFDSWEDTVQAVNGMCRAGVIERWEDLDWTLRPEPWSGTVGVTVADSQPSLFHIAAHAAVVQCVVEEAIRAVQAGKPLPLLPMWVVRENKFRAARFGLDTKIIVDEDGNEQPAREAFARRIDELQGIARDLGCEGELVSCLLLLDSTPAERQRATLRGGNRIGLIDSLRTDFLR